MEVKEKVIKNIVSEKSRKAIGVFFVATLMLAFGGALPTLVTANGSTSYTNLTVDEAYRMIHHAPSSLVILDVRNQSEFDEGHLYSATLVPVHEIQNRTSYNPLPPPATNDSLILDIYRRANSGFQLQSHINDPIIVYCKSGSRSTVASQILIDHGFTKVYNVIGGITAWMQADYPIYTSYHHVSVDIVNEETLVEIEPWLLYQTDCGCQNSTCSGKSPITATNTSQTVLEDSENHTVSLITGEINGAFISYTVNNTLLWRYNELDNGLNRTVTLVSTLITKDDNVTHVYGLNDHVQNEGYNVTVRTLLYPLNSTAYSRSVTTVEFVPSEEKGITSAERVDFVSPLTLSQLYASLDKVINKLGKDYSRSEDSQLKVFAQRYYTMADEAKMLSKLVETMLPQYNIEILDSTAAITDLTLCDVCGVACGIGIIIGCTIATYFTVGVAAIICLEYGFDIYDSGCSTACYIVCNSQPGTSPFFVFSVTGTEQDGGTVDNAGNIAGASNNQNYAHIHCSDYPDSAKIFGYMNADAHGHIYLYGYSGAGYYSDLYVYVSPDNNNWYYVNSLRITTSSPYTIDVGTYGNNFRYIAVCGYDGGFSVCLYIDAVSVVP